jgi:hypothetical protein
MSVQMYLVHPRNSGDERTREEIAEFIALRNGFILMATSYGSIIAAFDELYVDALRTHSAVQFVGGVTLNPEGRAAAELKDLFARNVALQLAERAAQQPYSAPASNPQSLAYSPGYRSLRLVNAEERTVPARLGTERDERKTWLPRFR